MNVLTIYANPNPRSFNHAILDQFTKGLRDAGHTSEVVDLYAIKFDPVLSDRDAASWIVPSMPEEWLDNAHLPESLLESAHNPLQRFLVKRFLRGKSSLDIVKEMNKHKPEDVLEQQEKVAWAHGLAFISPVYFLGFPAILKGWIERVFTPEFAFGMTDAGWQGDVNGRLPLLKHEKALVISTTFFDEASYDTGLRDGIGKVIDDWCLRYPGIRQVEHVYFYAVGAVDDDTRRGYLERAYDLGKAFEPQRLESQVVRAQSERYAAQVLSRG